MILTTNSPVLLRHVRISRGLSIRALAELSGLHRNVISDVERRIRNPSLAEISAIAEALSFSPPADLLREVVLTGNDVEEVNDVR